MKMLALLLLVSFNFLLLLTVGITAVKKYQKNRHDFFIVVLYIVKFSLIFKVF